MPEYNGPDSPPIPFVIVNYLDAEGNPLNAQRLALDYESTGKVEVCHGGPFPKFNIVLDRKA